MEIPQLVFHARDPHWQPQQLQPFVAYLQERQFLGMSIAAGPAQRYLAGESFLQNISFMGCSPAIEFAPPDTNPASVEKFTHIRFSEIYPDIHFCYDLRQSKPRCLQCRARLDNWYSQFAHGISAQQTLRCSRCDNQAQLMQLPWRRTAGFGRFFIQILNIYPQEAVPTDAFLAQLSRYTATQWDYFYVSCAYTLNPPDSVQ